MSSKMYMKIWGLKKLEEEGLLYPPYQIISINEDNPDDIKKYVHEKIRLVNLPNIKNDRIGVTIRVSLPGNLDKMGKHGGLHHRNENEILEIVLQKHEQYKPLEKIILQHTVDAKCSGAIVKDNEKIIIEAIPGDAPPLLQGETNNFESWTYYFYENKLLKNQSYTNKINEKEILSKNELNSLIKTSKNFDKNVYLEWSISKNEKFFYYEYLEIPGR